MKQKLSILRIKTTSALNSKSKFNNQTIEPKLKADNINTENLKPTHPKSKDPTNPVNIIKLKSIVSFFETL
jgi:hypothetical protein